MSDDATARELSRLRDDFRENFTEIKATLAGLLPREVYVIQRESDQHRIAAFEAELRAFELRLDAVVESFGKQLQAVDDKRTGTRRWVISSAILPTAAMIVTIVLFLLGQQK